jgi:TrmH family RNA methyltransferase
MMITRRAHPLLKELRELRDRPHKELLFLEGPRLIEEALQARIPLQTLVVSSTLVGHAELVGRAKARAQQTYSVSDAIFRTVSDVEEPQGMLAIGERPTWRWEHMFARCPAPILVLEGLQNPGNIASILRTAEAAGAAGVITTPETTRLASPKALRGAMGSSLRLPAMEHVAIEAIADRLINAGCMVYGTAADTDKRLRSPLPYTDIDWTQPSAIVFGREGGGALEKWQPFLHKIVTIPMQPPVESLNVSAAAAIVLYEAARQRKKGR